jgi:hypothetical protein
LAIRPGTRGTVETVRTCGFALCVCIATLTSSRALAQNAPTLSPAGAHVEIAPEPPDAKMESTMEHVRAEQAREEAPLPPPPRHKGLVLETTLGVLGFAGKFGSVAPTAFWMQAQIGYELLSWLMLFGQAELAFTDTSRSQDGLHSRAFPIWGFGGGARVTWHGKHVGLFAELAVGALTAYVPHGALSQLGFSGAESFGAQFGGRAGVEWPMADPHFALCLAGGPRVTLGFGKQGIQTVGGPAKEGVPLMWDTEGGVRYTF